MMCVTLTQGLKAKGYNYVCVLLDALVAIIPCWHRVCEERVVPSICWASEVWSWNIFWAVFRTPILTERCYIIFQCRYVRVKATGTSTIQCVCERILIVTNGFIIVEGLAIAECKHTSNHTTVPASAYIAAIVWICWYHMVSRRCRFPKLDHRKESSEERSRKHGEISNEDIRLMSCGGGAVGRVGW